MAYDRGRHFDRIILLSRTACQLVLTAVFIVVSPTAWAWSEQGHRIIVEIAEQRLPPEVAAAARLMANDPVTAGKPMHHFASWADRLRALDPEAAHSRWHVVDVDLGDLNSIPYRTPRYDAARDCPDGGCIVAAIKRETALLSDRRRPDTERLTALLWLIHLVGDAGQPLHIAGDRDRGGLQVRISNYCDLFRYCPRPFEQNLHFVWDDGLVETAIATRGVRPGEYLGELIRDLDTKRYVSSQVGTTDPETWANDSVAIARVAYGPDLGPHHYGPGTIDLSPVYLRTMVPVVELQLQKSGMRLPALLTNALSPRDCALISARCLVIRAAGPKCPRSLGQCARAAPTVRRACLPCGSRRRSNHPSQHRVSDSTEPGLRLKTCLRNYGASKHLDTVADLQVESVMPIRLLP